MLLPVLPLPGPPGVRLPARVWDMKFCLTSLILCCSCFLLVNSESCSARNLLVAEADGKNVPSLVNNSITNFLCLLKVRRWDVDSLVSSAVRQGDVGVRNEADSGVFCLELDDKQRSRDETTAAERSKFGPKKRC